MMDDLKTPPKGEENEMFVIGSCLVDREAVEKSMEILEPEDFYNGSNQEIFRVCLELCLKNQAVDIQTVSSELRRSGRLEMIGAEHMTSCIEIVTTSQHVEFHSLAVKNYSVMRSLINDCSKVINGCYDHKSDVEELVEMAERAAFLASKKAFRAALPHVGKSVHNVIESIEMVRSKKSETTGLPTGFRRLDEITSGFQPGNMVVLASRPGMGKTSLAIDFVRHAAIKMEKPVAFFSLEMTKGEILMRMFSAISGIPLWCVRTGKFSDSKWTDLNMAAQKVYESQIFMEASSAVVTPIGIRSSCRRLATKLLREKNPLGLIVVDYLQLLSSPGKARESRQAEVAEISRSLKLLAMDLDVPILALSQLNRQTEEMGRAGRPRLSDLRESGAIEQDSDLVMFIYREAFYKAGATDEEMARTKLIVAKHRNGALGEVDLWFDRDHTRFIEMEKEVS